ncbi:hypothetical protein [Glycomyces sp. NPDC048151]|uniref:hypothetical protein n=1 Tax=Glycomyces sp. NPDC048151 TaxID=3364002 RepID=UPI00371B0563
MNDIVTLTIEAAFLAVSIAFCYRARHWALRAESDAKRTKTAAAAARTHKDAMIARAIELRNQ